VAALTGAGTPESVWSETEELHGLARAELDVASAHRVVVVAPHPDDEILGVGGLLSALAASGSEILVMAVTDGEASHPGMARSLRRRRPLESQAAMGELGVDASTHRLEHPDGAVDREMLEHQLQEVITADDLVLAPWVRDGHPDHDAVGAAAMAACAAVGASLWGYLVWTWHWATPADLPWSAMIRFDLGDALSAKKRRAVGHFVSQLEGAEPILPPHVMERLIRPFEVFVAP
jgi:LmbE family N-acetylglucosaminyl deacetylase